MTFHQLADCAALLLTNVTIILSDVLLCASQVSYSRLADFVDTWSPI